MATILCLDDEPAIGLILQDTLERAGHQTVSAHNVPQALQALAAGTVDLIISDYRMPGLTGLEFLANDPTPSERDFVVRRAREVANEFRTQIDPAIAARLRALGADIDDPSPAARPLDVLWEAVRS